MAWKSFGLMIKQINKRETKLNTHTAVLSSGSAQRAIRRDGDGVDVSGVTDVVGLQTAVSEVPDLDDLVPSSGDDHGAAVGEETVDTQSVWQSS